MTCLDADFGDVLNKGVRIWVGYKAWSEEFQTQD